MTSSIRTVKYTTHGLVDGELPPACAEIMKQVGPMMQRMVTLRDAHNTFIRQQQGKEPKDSKQAKALYQTIYDDIKDNSGIWFNANGVFSQDWIFSKMTVEILLNLAKTRRVIGRIQECIDILKVNKLVIEVFKSMAKDRRNAEVFNCCMLLMYKHNTICVNAHSQMRNPQQAVNALRQVVECELRNPNAAQVDTRWNESVQQYILHSSKKMTVEQLNNIPDEQIWLMLNDIVHPKVKEGTGCIPEDQLNSGDDVTKCLKILNKAHYAFSDIPRETGKPNYTHSEKLYHALYVDIRDSPNIWFDVIFPLDSTYAEWTVGILGTLATMRRQRGLVPDCLDILEIDTRVLHVYQEMVKDTTDPDIAECCMILTYKYNLIRINAHTQMSNMKPAVDAFRQIVSCEIENPSHPELAHWDEMVQSHIFHTNKKMTMKKLKSFSDAEIWRMLQRIVEPIGEDVGGSCYCPLRLCDNCGDQEEMLGNYKCCSLCKQVWYCNKACQREHWKGEGHHKVDCGKEPTCKIESEQLKAVANQLIKNYSGTVKNHGGYSVTEQEKKAVFPKLVNFFKTLVIERPELNEPLAFKDAGHDPDVCDKLNAFFEQQAGFESLIQIHNTPMARSAKERLCSENSLRIDDDTLHDFCKVTVDLFRSRFDEKDINDSHEELLIDVVAVELTKILLENPKYNSYKGLNELKDDPKALTQIALKMAETMTRENPDEWLDQDAKPQEQEIQVDEDKMKLLADAAIEAVVLSLRQLGKLDGKPRREFAKDVVFLLIKEHVSTRPEFNSNDTVLNLIDDDVFKSRCTDLAITLL